VWEGLDMRGGISKKTWGSKKRQMKRHPCGAGGGRVQSQGDRDPAVPTSRRAQIRERLDKEGREKRYKDAGQPRTLGHSPRIVLDPLPDELVEPPYSGVGTVKVNVKFR